MKKFICFVALISVAASALNAQEMPKTEKSQSVTVNLLGLQYNYETPLSRLTTVNLHGGLGSDLIYSKWSSWNGDTNSQWAYSFRGVAGADFRYFYNLDRRDRKGKNTRFNSGNFLSLDMIYVTPAIYSKNIDTSHGFLIIPNYGFRRVYKSGWMIEPRVGYAVGYAFKEWGGNLKLDFKVGYSF